MREGLALFAQLEERQIEGMVAKEIDSHMLAAELETG